MNNLPETYHPTSPPCFDEIPLISILSWTLRGGWEVSEVCCHMQGLLSHVLCLCVGTPRVESLAIFNPTSYPFCSKYLSVSALARGGCLFILPFHLPL